MHKSEKKEKGRELEENRRQGCTITIVRGRWRGKSRTGGKKREESRTGRKGGKSKREKKLKKDFLAIKLYFEIFS